MLEAHELTQRYGTHTALNALNLSISAGEVFCLLGANGAGRPRRSTCSATSSTRRAARRGSTGST
jgi:ABC-type multidrug transport system ATPase subunit